MTSNKSHSQSFIQSLGVGVGIRKEHYDLLIEGKPTAINWGEALTENYLRWDDGFLPHSAIVLEKIRKHMPIALHGVALSLASAESVKQSYFRHLKELISRVDPIWISDHLCWTGVGKHNSHDLLPFPFTSDFLKVIVDKIDFIQSELKRPILVENVSSYLSFADSTFTEWDFLIEVARRSGCGLLLDINNIYVNSFNHKYDPLDFLSAIPAPLVGQIHLAGHRRYDTVIIDTHDNFICDEVWALYRTWVQQNGQQSVLLEWDFNVPSWETMEKELLKIRHIYENKQGKSRTVAATVL
jgi:uncharacterized protein (UPF0276 family)